MATRNSVCYSYVCWATQNSVRLNRLERGGASVKAFLFGIIITLVAVPIFGLLYLRSSYMPVAATDPPSAI